MEARNDPVTVYCLGLIAEEAGEAVQAAGQALRFGLDTPGGPGVRARDALENEIGDIIAAAQFAAAHGLLDLKLITARASQKLEKLCDPRLTDLLARPLAPQPPLERPSAS